MNISPINNNITTNYYNHTKFNHKPAFKGVFIGDVTDEKTCKKIENFFKKYMSPGCNVARSDFFYPLKTPSYSEKLELSKIPEKCVGDLNFYITNAKAIEDDVLDQTINYYKEYVDKYNFKPYPWSDQNVTAYEMFKMIHEYLDKQYKYVEKYPERLPATYKAKLDLFKDFTNSMEFQKVYKALESFGKR